MSVVCSAAAVVLAAVMLGYKFNHMLLTVRQESVKPPEPFKKPVGLVPALVYAGILSLLLFFTDIGGVYVMELDLLLSLIMTAAADIKKRAIPNMMTLSTLLSQLSIMVLAEKSVPTLTNLALSAAMFLLLALLSKITGEQIGMGDVKLLTTVNVIYGLSFTMYSMIFALFLILLAAIPGIIMKKITLKSALPFAPFYVIGTIIYLFLSI